MFELEENMNKVNVLVPLAEGFEEVEAMTIVDLLRRAEIDVTTANVTGGEWVKGAHGVPLKADCSISDVRSERYEAIVLPGGMPGASHLAESEEVATLLKDHFERGKNVAAICAAPMVLAKHGLLQGKKATCYPGFEEKLSGAEPQTGNVVQDGTITTSRGPATAIPFALSLIATLMSPEKAREVQEGLLA